MPQEYFFIMINRMKSENYYVYTNIYLKMMLVRCKICSFHISLWNGDIGIKKINICADIESETISWILSTSL